MKKFNQLLLVAVAGVVLSMPAIVIKCNGVQAARNEESPEEMFLRKGWERFKITHKFSSSSGGQVLVTCDMKSKREFFVGYHGQITFTGEKCN